MWPWQGTNFGKEMKNNLGMAATHQLLLLPPFCHAALTGESWIRMSDQAKGAITQEHTFYFLLRLKQSTFLPLEFLLLMEASWVMTGSFVSPKRLFFFSFQTISFFATFYVLFFWAPLVQRNLTSVMTGPPCVGLIGGGGTHLIEGSRHLGPPSGGSWMWLNWPKTFSPSSSLSSSSRLLFWCEI